MFVDASVVIAVLTFEPEKERFEAMMRDADELVTSPLVVYESVLGVARKLACSIADAQSAITDFLKETEAVMVAIEKDTGDAAVAAFERFGRGRHRARLNMGDCFAYACAKVHGVPLLCKGDDFIHTDIELA